VTVLSSFVFLKTDAIVMPPFRLRGAGLLTFCRLVEGGPIGRHGRGRPRLMIDNSLITALVDRWRPETHAFHMPCGEMAPTLQDVSYLLGLPIAGTAVGPRVVPASWKDDLEIRFAGVDRLDDLGALEPHPNARGPAKAWLLQFKVHCFIVVSPCYLLLLHHTYVDERITFTLANVGNQSASGHRR